MADTVNFTGMDGEAAGRYRPFLEGLLQSRKDGIHSIHVTGSAVSGGYDPGRSDVNSVIVLHEMDLGFLEALAPLGKKYGRKKVSPPLIMTPQYVRESLDVFPIEFLNLHHIHRTVYGEDMFADLQVKSPDLRLQCERDLKAKLIGLRQGYLASAGNARILNEDFSMAISGYMPLFRAIVFLKSGEFPIRPEEVIARLGEVSGVDTGVYARVFKKKLEHARLPIGELNRLFEEYYLATESLGAVVDEIQA